MKFIYNVSLQHPDFPTRDELAQMTWKNPLVPLDQAIRATVGPREVVFGDPTDFNINSPDSDQFDWGWDLG